MATETERKFLVKGEFLHLATGSVNITQSYLSIDPEKTIRIRIAGEKACITIKGRAKEGSISRGEWEYMIPLSDANELIELCHKGKIVKTRFIVPEGGHTWEVDVFHDKNEGLVIAEIELSSENEKFIMPGWLGEEVTGNPAYYNSNLIK
jgi:adenylate cyclase